MSDFPAIFSGKSVVKWVLYPFAKTSRKQETLLPRKNVFTGKIAQCERAFQFVAECHQWRIQDRPLGEAPVLK